MEVNRHNVRRESKGRTFRPIHWGTALAAAAVAAGTAFAGPEGEQVVRGQANFTRQGSNTLIEVGHNAIIQYDRFNIGAGESVQFLQPGVSARVLNRIVGAEPTRIDGQLSANGRVYFVNPAGVIFGENAIVNVGALYAAAGHIDNDDFINGIDRFTRLTGGVENFGRIEGSQVHLLGQYVGNHGSIVASEGLITMTSGNEVFIGEEDGHLMLRLTTTGDGAAGAGVHAGVTNTGNLDAEGGSVHLGAGDIFGVAIHHSGSIRARHVSIDGGNGKANISGAIDASDTAPGGVGGNIDITASELNLTGASITASGDAGGGSIRIGGDFHGLGDMPTSNVVSLDGQTIVSADAISTGDGGRVIIWANENLDYDGNISVRGGSESGNGGFAEVSSAFNMTYTGTFDGAALAGEHGTLLIDPTDVIFRTGGPGNPLDASPYASAPGTLVIDPANVPFSGTFVVQATNNVTFESSLIRAGSLTVQAGGSIAINPSLSVSSSEGSLRFEADAASSPIGAADGVGTFATGAGVTVSASGAITIYATDFFINSSSSITTANDNIVFQRSTNATFAVGTSMDAQLNNDELATLVGGLIYIGDPDAPSASPIQFTGADFGSKNVAVISLAQIDDTTNGSANLITSGDLHVGSGNGVGQLDLANNADGLGVDVGGDLVLSGGGDLPFLITNTGTLGDLTIPFSLLSGNADVTIVQLNNGIDANLSIAGDVTLVAPNGPVYSSGNTGIRTPGTVRVDAAELGSSSSEASLIIHAGVLDLRAGGDGAFVSVGETYPTTDITMAVHNSQFFSYYSLSMPDESGFSLQPSGLALQADVFLETEIVSSGPPLAAYIDFFNSAINFTLISESASIELNYGDMGTGRFEAIILNGTLEGVFSEGADLFAEGDVYLQAHAIGTFGGFSISGDNDASDDSLEIVLTGPGNSAVTTSANDFANLFVKTTTDAAGLTLDLGGTHGVDIAAGSGFATLSRIDIDQAGFTEVKLAAAAADLFVDAPTSSVASGLLIASYDDIHFATTHESGVTLNAANSASDLILFADADLDGSGAVTIESGDFIQLSSSADSFLRISAGSGVGTAATPLHIENISGFSVRTNSGDIYLRDNSTGDANVGPLFEKGLPSMVGVETLSSGDISIDRPNALTGSGAGSAVIRSAGGDITLIGDTLNFASMPIRTHSGGSISLVGSTQITTNDLIATDVSLGGGGDISISGSAVVDTSAGSVLTSSGGSINITPSNSVTTALLDARVDGNGGGDVLLNATSVSIIDSVLTSAGGAIDITASGLINVDVLNSSASSGNGAITVTSSNSSISTGSISSGSDVTLDAGPNSTDDVTVSGFISAPGVVDLTAGNRVEVSSGFSLTNPQSITVTAGSEIQLADATSVGHQFYDAPNFNAHGNIESLSGNITFTGNYNGFGEVALDPQSVTAAGTIAGNNFFKISGTGEDFLLSGMAINITDVGANGSTWQNIEISAGNTSVNHGYALNDLSVFGTVQLGLKLRAGNDLIANDAAINFTGATGFLAADGGSINAGPLSTSVATVLDISTGEGGGSVAVQDIGSASNRFDGVTIFANGSASIHDIFSSSNIVVEADSISLSSTLSSAGLIDIDGPLTINDNALIQSSLFGDLAIRISSTIDGSSPGLYELTLNAFNGFIEIGGNVGSTGALSRLFVNTRTLDMSGVVAANEIGLDAFQALTLRGDLTVTNNSGSISTNFSPITVDTVSNSLAITTLDAGTIEIISVLNAADINETVTIDSNGGTVVLVEGANDNATPFNLIIATDELEAAGLFDLASLNASNVTGDMLISDVTAFTTATGDINFGNVLYFESAQFGGETESEPFSISFDAAGGDVTLPQYIGFSDDVMNVSANSDTGDIRTGFVYSSSFTSTAPMGDTFVFGEIQTAESISITGNVRVDQSATLRSSTQNVEITGNIDSVAGTNAVLALQAPLGDVSQSSGDIGSADQLSSLTANGVNVALESIDTIGNIGISATTAFAFNGDTMEGSTINIAAPTISFNGSGVSFDLFGSNGVAITGNLSAMGLANNLAIRSATNAVSVDGNIALAFDSITVDATDFFLRRVEAFQQISLTAQNEGAGQGILAGDLILDPQPAGVPAPTITIVADALSLDPGKSSMIINAGTGEIDIDAPVSGDILFNLVGADVTLRQAVDLSTDLGSINVNAAGGTINVNGVHTEGSQSYLGDLNFLGGVIRSDTDDVAADDVTGDSVTFLLLGSEVTLNTGSVTALNGSVSITALNGELNTGGQNIDAAGGDVIIDVALLSAGNISATQFEGAGGSVNVNTRIADLNANDFTADAGLTLNSLAGQITGGDINASGELSLTALNGISIGSVVAPAGSTTLLATGVNADITTGAIVSNDDIDIQTSRDFTSAGQIASTNGHIDVQTGGGIDIDGDVLAPVFVNLVAGTDPIDNLGVTGNIDTNGALTASAGGTVDVTGTIGLATPDTVSITAATINLADVNSINDQTFNGPVNASGDFISMLGSITFADDLNVVTSAGTAVSAGQNITGNDIHALASGADISMIAGTVGSGESTLTIGNVGSIASPFASVSLAGDELSFGTIQASDGVTISGDLLTISGTTIHTTSGNIDVDGLLTSFANQLNVVSDAGNVEIAAVSDPTSVLALTVSGSQVSLGPIGSSDMSVASVDITGSTSINLLSAFSDEGQSFSSPNINVGETHSNNASGDIVFNGDVFNDAATVVSNTSGSIVFNGDVNGMPLLAVDSSNNEFNGAVGNFGAFGSLDITGDTTFLQDVDVDGAITVDAPTSIALSGDLNAGASVDAVVLDAPVVLYSGNSSVTGNGVALTGVLNATTTTSTMRIDAGDGTLALPTGANSNAVPYILTLTTSDTLEIGGVFNLASTEAAGVTGSIHLVDHVTINADSGIDLGNATGLVNAPGLSLRSLTMNLNGPAATLPSLGQSANPLGAVSIHLSQTGSGTSGIAYLGSIFADSFASTLTSSNAASTSFAGSLLSVTGDIDVASPRILVAAPTVTVTSQGGHITFDGNVDSAAGEANALIVTSDDGALTRGDVTFTDNIGESDALDSIAIFGNNISVHDITAANGINIDAAGLLSISSDLSTSSPTNDGAIDLIAAQINLLSLSTNVTTVGGNILFGGPTTGAGATSLLNIQSTTGDITLTDDLVAIGTFQADGHNISLQGVDAAIDIDIDAAGALIAGDTLNAGGMILLEGSSIQAADLAGGTSVGISATSGDMNVANIVSGSTTNITAAAGSIATSSIASSDSLTASASTGLLIDGTLSLGLNNATLSSLGDDIELLGDINLPGLLTLSTPGEIIVLADIGNNTAPSGVAATASNTSYTAVTIHTTGDQSYTGNLSLSGVSLLSDAGNIVVTGETVIAGTTQIDAGNVTLGAIGAPINALSNTLLVESGTVHIGGDTDLDPLDQLTINATTVNHNGVTTIGMQQYTAATLNLHGDLNATGMGVGSIMINAGISSIEGSRQISVAEDLAWSGDVSSNGASSLSIDSAAGDVLFTGALDIDAIDTNATVISIAEVTTSQGQSYTGTTLNLSGNLSDSATGAFDIDAMINLLDNITLATTDGDVDIDGAVAGAGFDLTVNAPDNDISVTGPISTRSIAMLGSTTTANNATTSLGQIYNGTLISSGLFQSTQSGSIIINGDLTLADDTTLRTAAGPANNIDINGAISGPFDLTLESSNIDLIDVNSTFGRVNQLAVAADTLLRLSGNIDASNMDFSSVTGMVSLIGNSSISTDSAVNLANSAGINSAGGAHDLSIDAGTAAIMLPGIGANSPVGLLSLNTDGDVMLNGNIQARAVDAAGLTGVVHLGDSITINVTDGGLDMRNAASIEGSSVGGQNLSIIADAAGTALPGIGNTTALGSLSIVSTGQSLIGGDIQTQLNGANSGDIVLSGDVLINSSGEHEFSSIGGNVDLTDAAVLPLAANTTDLIIDAVDVSITDVGSVESPFDILRINSTGVLTLGGQLHANLIDTDEVTGAMRLAADTFLFSNGDVNLAQGLGIDSVGGPWALNINAGNGNIAIGSSGETSPLRELSLITTGQIGFFSTFVVTDLVEINPDGRSAVPTIASSGKVEGALSFIVLNPSGSFVMGQNEKLTVGGHLTIDAANVTLADISVLGDLTIVADHVALQRRPRGVNQTISSIQQDPGVDIVAGRAITFIGRTNPTAAPAFSDVGDPSGAAPVFANGSGIATGVPFSYEVIRFLNKLRSIDLFLNGVLLDAVASTSPGGDPNSQRQPDAIEVRFDDLTTNPQPAMPRGLREFDLTSGNPPLPTWDAATLFDWQHMNAELPGTFSEFNDYSSLGDADMPELFDND